MRDHNTKPRWRWSITIQKIINIKQSLIIHRSGKKGCRSVAPGLKNLDGRSGVFFRTGSNRPATRLKVSTYLYIIKNTVLAHVLYNHPVYVDIIMYFLFSLQILHSFIDLGFRPGYIIYEDLHERAFELPVVTEKYMNDSGYALMSRRGWNLVFCHRTRK